MPRPSLVLPLRAAVAAPVRVLLAGALAAGGLAAVGCSRSVAVSLKVVEPCDQTGAALGGVESYAIASSGTDAPSIVTFKASDAPPSLDVGLTATGSAGVVVSVQAFSIDVTASAPSPDVLQAVGRTVPLPLAADTPDLDVLVPVGLVDGFGQTTDGDGACTVMNTGGAIAGRHGHTATYVPLLGKVLIYGGAVYGEDGSESILDTAELWDPATGAFETIEVDEDETTPRAYHAASLLPDGRVLLSGGFGVISGQVSALGSADIFDPGSLNFSQMLLKQPRAHHTSSVLERAGILVLAGGCSGSGTTSGCSPGTAGAGNSGDSTGLQFTMEIIDLADPDSGPTAVPDDSALTSGRAFHTATVLNIAADKSLLVIAGGLNGAGIVGDLELFRGEAGALVKVDDTLLASFPFGRAPVRHAAVAVSDSQILFIGGQTAASGGAAAGPATADVWNFTTTAGIDPVPVRLSAARTGHQAILLENNGVLVVGGVASSTTEAAAATAEVLEPGAQGFSARFLARSLIDSIVGMALTPLPNGQVLITGGHTAVAPFETTDAAHLFFPRPASP